MCKIKSVFFYIFILFSFSTKAQHLQTKLVSRNRLKVAPISFSDSNNINRVLRKGIKYQSFEIDYVVFSQDSTINEAFKNFNNELIDFDFSKNNVINSDLVIASLDSLLNNRIYFGTPMILLDTSLKREFYYHTRGFTERTSYLPMRYFTKKINLKMYFLCLMELLISNFRIETERLVIEDVLFLDLKNKPAVISNQSFFKLFSVRK